VIDAFGSRGFGVIAITDHLCESRTTLGKAAGFLGHTLTPATFPQYKAPQPIRRKALDPMAQGFAYLGLVRPQYIGHLL